MSSIKVLYMSYNAAIDSVAQSQVIPYVEKLAEQGIDISLLTYEKKTNKHILEFNKALKERLARSGIIWYRLSYHKRPSLPATIYDILQGAIFTYFLLLRRKFNIIHARQIVPATICLVLRKIIKFKWVFDMRGLFAEESVSHNWREGGLKFRSVKLMEKSSLLSADFITVLTHRQKNFISDESFLSNKNKRIEVIPCCVDLRKFSIVERSHDAVNELELQGKFVLIYLGSLGTCYLLSEMIDFFLHLRKKINNAFFLFVTHSDKALVINMAKEKGLGNNNFKVITSSFNKIPTILSVCDVGIYFINSYMKLGSFPIKLSEYLACGLPVVINANIGDSEEIVKKNGVGIVVEDFSVLSYEKTAEDLYTLLEGKDELRMRCRIVAERFLSLEQGSEKYRSIYLRLAK